MRVLAMAAGLILILSGCDLLGPSPDEVRNALDAVARGVKSSTSADIKPDIHSEYVNKGELTYTSADGSTVHNMSIFIDTDTDVMKIRGDCSFNDYQDGRTGYKVNGEFSYSLDGIRKTGVEGMFGDIDCQVSLEGGKIRSIDMKLSRAGTA
jgi:hypothetical protein